MDARSCLITNQILALKGSDGSVRAPSGFREVTAPKNVFQSDVLRVFATPGATLAVDSDPLSDVHVYLWGLASHERIARTQIARWIGAQTAHCCAKHLRDALGCYVALVDDRQSGHVHIVNDVAGTRPFFASMQRQTFVCGSDVWTMAQLGWVPHTLNHNAIAAWVRAAYDFTEGSLFSDLSLIEPGAVTTLRDGQLVVNSYTQLSGGCERPSLDQHVEELHDIVSRAFRTLTRDAGPLQIAVSGGFDSRYLAALAAQEGIKVRATCLADHPSEIKVGSEVASRLGLTLNVIQTDGSRWNIYDEPFHFSPSGFPISKQQTYAITAKNPGIPCLNGFLGDGLVRGSVDRLDGKLPWEVNDEQAARLFQRAQNLRHTHARYDLLDPGFLRRCDQRTLPACRRHLARYAHTGNAFAGAMYLRRHRTYFGNNFVQHLSLAEPVLPFASFDMFQHKAQTHPDCFSWDNYPALFARFFRKLADIPHNKKTTNGPEPFTARSRVTPRWAMKMLAAMTTRNALRCFNACKTVPRLIGALRGGNRADVVALFAYRLYLLEERLRTIGIELEWDAI